MGGEATVAGLENEVAAGRLGNDMAKERRAARGLYRVKGKDQAGLRWSGRGASDGGGMTVDQDSIVR